MDWPAIAPAVCRRLLGEPNRRLSNTRELRWGRRGSLRLDLESGRLFDFEADTSLGLLDLVARACGLADRRAARQWLVAEGFLRSQAYGHGARDPVRAGTRARPHRRGQDGTERRQPFWQADLPRLDFAPVPDDPEHPLNRWAFLKCARPEGASWPAGCRWLRGPGDPQDPKLHFLGGPALMVPLARPEAWTTLGHNALPRTAVRGIHAVLIHPDGRPRALPSGRNKTDWAGGRTGTTAGCGFLAGRPAFDGTLALCEGLADALAIHWRLDLPALAACGSLAGLADGADELAQLTRFPLNLTLQVWPDRDRVNPETGLRAGAAGALSLTAALLAAGANPDRLRIRQYGEPGTDPADYIRTLAHAHAHGGTP